MALHDGLAGLPVELLDAVINELVLQDVCNLRLAAGILANNVAQTSFRSRFRSKNLWLTHERLETFSVVMKQSWISSALEHLTIMGLIAYPEPQQDDFNVNSPENLTLLTSGLKSLRLQSGNDHLCSLVLSVE